MDRWLVKRLRGYSTGDISIAPSGLGNDGDVVRWLRFAPPPATVYHPLGIILSDENVLSETNAKCIVSYFITTDPLSGRPEKNEM